MSMELEPPHTHFVTAAIGWMELGNLKEARAELSQLDPSLALHPSVLNVRWLISAREENWEESLEVAHQLIEVAPEQPEAWLRNAYALRRVKDGGVQQAWDALLPAAQAFPKEPTIPYNISCYACQLGQLETAMKWLRRAIRVGNKQHVKTMALQDPDLKALWPRINRL